MRIAYVGNYVVSWTTESHRAASFEELGHKVLRLQENQTTARQLRELMSKIDLLLYSHTHSPEWEIDGLVDVLKEYKDAGVSTASVHLDVFAGLEREKDVGREAMWFCEYVFTADGSPEAAKLYDSKGINWHWLKPGVYGKECYLAKPDRRRFPHDVIFVGSRQYHKEYPFRPKLVDWLKQTYGERFGHYGSDGIALVRGKDLNTLYASAKVAVGDSCFGGRSRYWSDRVTETTGRGGFLIHPYIDDEGIDNPYIAGFDKDNLAGGPASLKGTIDHYLANDDYREIRRIQAHEWTRDNATYTVRSREMLEVMGL